MIPQIDLGHDVDALAPRIEAQRRIVARESLRARLLVRGADTVRVAVRLHLIPQRLERELREQLAMLDDRIAVLRHCDPRLDPRCNDMLEHARTMRQRLADQLAAFVVEIDAVIARPPMRGPDWSVADLPVKTIETVQAEFATMRCALAAVADRIVDSELLRILDGCSRASSDRVECTLIEFDLDSVERVRAFVAAVDSAVDEANRAVLWLRIASMTVDQRDPQTGTAATDASRRMARQDLDVLRSRQAAIADLKGLPS